MFIQPPSAVRSLGIIQSFAVGGSDLDVVDPMEFSCLLSTRDLFGDNVSSDGVGLIFSFIVFVNSLHSPANIGHLGTDSGRDMPALSAEQLQEIPLFTTLEPEQLELILDRHRETSHQADQVLVMEQDWGESVFLMMSGLAKVRTYTADGDEVVMSLLGPGDVFGEMVALEGSVRSADVVTLTPVALVKLRVQPFSTLLRQKAGFALALASLETSRLRDLNRRFALQSADATSRLLDALAYLARKSSHDQDPLARIPCLAQREIGLLAGLARETASRTLSKLRTKGTVVEEDGTLMIVDSQALIKRGLVDPAEMKK